MVAMAMVSHRRRCFSAAVRRASVPVLKRCSKSAFSPTLNSLKMTRNAWRAITLCVVLGRVRRAPVSHTTDGTTAASVGFSAHAPGRRSSDRGCPCSWFVRRRSGASEPCRSRSKSSCSCAPIVIKQQHIEYDNDNDNDNDNYYDYARTRWLATRARSA